MTTKTAHVLSWTGHRNIGDESYPLSFSKLFPDVAFSFSDLNVTPRECDNAVLGGGHILYPHYVDQLLKIPAKRRVVLSVSAGDSVPVDLLKHVDQIFVRDKWSLEILASKGIPCDIMPDISMCLDANAETGKLWLQEQYKNEGLELYNKRVGLVLNGHLYHDEPDLSSRDFLTLMRNVWELGRLADNTSASFVFFPMSTQVPHDDRILNAMIGGRCKFWRKNLIIHDQLTVQQTIDLIAACDVIISTRLHSTLFSIVSEIPFLDLVHNKKNRGYLDSIGLSDWSIPFGCCCYENLQQMLNDRLSNRGQYERLLKAVHIQQVKELDEGAKRVRFV